MRVGVVVLGDLGRSPRMSYHAQSLANNNHEVDFIGYSGSELSEQIKSNKNIRIKHIRKTLSLPNLPKLIQYFIKTILQSVYLLISLPVISKLDCILVQTPPGVPTLPILYLYCTIKGTRLIVDFHNYSHTILAMACGSSHPLVYLSKFLEKICGQSADAAFCVSKAMQADLWDNWGIQATVLHDRPPEKFRPISTEEKHNLFLRLGNEYEAFKGESSSSTVFTREKDGQIELRDQRPGLVVSSTSWTEDEDFSILLDALVQYERRVRDKAGSLLPDLVCVITGKGDLKDFYLAKIKELDLQHVTFVTPWLSAEDYPTLLAAADVGISLHTSSSGLDLPMKVVDMFGCGLPVFAKKYPAIDELVVSGFNGDVFETAGGLGYWLNDWFKGFPTAPNAQHAIYRENLSEFRSDGWAVNWNKNAHPVIMKAVQMKEGSPLQITLFFVLLFLFFSAYLPTAQ